MLQIDSFTGNYPTCQDVPQCWAHVLDAVIFQVFIFNTECLISIDGSFSKFRCWCQSCPGSPRAVGAGFSVLTCAGSPRWTLMNWRAFHCCDELNCTGSPQLFHLWDLGRNLLFSLCLAKNVVALGLPRLCDQGSLRYDRLLASFSDPSFLFSRQSPRSGFDFAETCTFGISPGRFDMLSRKYESITKKGCWNMSDVTVNQTVTSIVSTVLAITRCWLTHQRFVDLDGLIELDLLKEPIKINSVGHENVPYDGTPAFNSQFWSRLRYLQTRKAMLAGKKCVR